MGQNLEVTKHQVLKSISGLQHVLKRSTTSIFSALPQEVSYETKNPSQFL